MPEPEHLADPHAARPRPGARLAPLRPDAGPHGAAAWSSRPTACGCGWPSRATGRGGELVDGMSSWWSAIHGYNHPVLNEAARGQLDRMSHVMFGGLTHEPAVRLAARLVEITPEPLQHVFLADSGSVSVEVAVKMCLQYWRSLGRPGQAPAADLARRLPRRHLAADVGLRPGRRHAPAVVGVAARAGLRGRAARRLRRPARPRVRRRTCGELIARHADELAAVIVEPVVQGAGGMRFHSPGYLRVLREACDEHDVLLVLRRDRHRLRPHRHAVRGRARRGRAGRDVRRQGADRRLPDAGRDAVHVAGRRGHLARARYRCWPTGRRSWATRWPPRWPAPRSTCCWTRTGRGRSSGSRPGCGRGSRPPRASPGVRDVRVLGAIGVVQLDHEVDVAAATRGRRARPGCGCARSAT